MVGVTLTLIDFGILVGIGATLTGGVRVANRRHIKNMVDEKVDGRIDVAVGQAMLVVSAKLDAIRINQRETSEAIGRIHELEVIVNNGLTKQVDRIEKQVDRLVEHQLN